MPQIRFLSVRLSVTLLTFSLPPTRPFSSWLVRLQVIYLAAGFFLCLVFILALLLRNFNGCFAAFFFVRSCCCCCGDLPVAPLVFCTLPQFKCQGGRSLACLVSWPPLNVVVSSPANSSFLQQKKHREIVSLMPVNALSSGYAFATIGH